MVRKHIRLGWKKDKYDHRDRLYRIVGATPTAFSLEQYLVPIRDQNDVGACIGFGIGGNISSMAKKLGLSFPASDDGWFSPEWIYNGARFIEGTLSEDAGAEPGDALNWLVKNGCLLEQYWPYNPNALDTTSPPSADMPLAAQYPMLAYTRITTGTAGICNAIANGYFVSIGTPWFDSWMNPPASGLLPAVNAQSVVDGGHETFLFGFSQPNQVFYGCNSWGPTWGNQGKYEMPFSAFAVFNKLGGYDAHIVDVNWSVAPVPAPTPTPTPTPVAKMIRLEESIDGGKTWSSLFQGNLK